MNKEIKDSGARTEYSSGAVRDIKTEENGRCDLLPLIEVGYFLDDTIIQNIGKYHQTKEVKYLKFAILHFSQMAYGNVYEALLELSKHFMNGAQKYGEYNWQKGIPESSYIDSAVRHYFKYRRGDQDEYHDRAFLWNLFCLWWTHNNITEEIK